MIYIYSQYYTIVYSNIICYILLPCSFLTLYILNESCNKISLAMARTTYPHARCAAALLVGMPQLLSQVAAELRAGR